MTPEEQIDADMNALFESVSFEQRDEELNERYCKLRNCPDNITDLQKNLLALSFGCHASGQYGAANLLYEAAGFLSGFKVRVRMDNDER